MFNYFVKLYLNSNYSFLQWNKRIKSTILELWYALSIFFPFLIITMILTPSFENTTRINLLPLIPFGLMMMAMINKDFFGAQSPVHRRLGYKVVDAKTNKKASKIRCMLRNITAPLWPIEVFFLLAHRKRRLGDFIAGTSLIEVEATDPELILLEIKNAKFDKETILTLLISTIWVIAFMLLFNTK